MRGRKRRGIRIPTAKETIMSVGQLTAAMIRARPIRQERINKDEPQRRLKKKRETATEAVMMTEAAGKEEAGRLTSGVMSSTTEAGGRRR